MLLMPLIYDYLFSAASAFNRHVENSGLISSIAAGKAVCAMSTQPSSADEPPAFWCDAMLGGLARWLRAAGYDAAWAEGIVDAELVRQALAGGRVLLTADTELSRHGAIRAGRVRAILLPSGIGKFDQLKFVMRSLGLARREPRCMACGGRLQAIPREAARPEVPPRTFAWLVGRSLSEGGCDEFYRCERCAKLFWRGTHWTRIEARLSSL